MKKTLLVCMLACWGTANAVTVLDFEELTTDGGSIGNTYSKDNLVLAHSIYQGGVGPASFGVIENQGSVALGHQLYGQTILATADHSAFDFLSIDLSTILAFSDSFLPGFKNSIDDITFTGTLLGGGSVTQTVPVDYLYGFQTFTFSGFTNVTEVTWRNPANIGEGLQFDNVTANVSAVPVPAAIWLLGSGLVGLVGLRKKSS